MGGKARWEGNGVSPNTMGRRFRGLSPDKIQPWLDRSRGSPSIRAHLVTKDLQGMGCRCHWASHPDMWPERVVSGLDRKGNLPWHLAFWSICFHASTLQPRGIYPSALDSGEGVLWAAAHSTHPPCPLTHPKALGQGPICIRPALASSTLQQRGPMVSPSI